MPKYIVAPVDSHRGSMQRFEIEHVFDATPERYLEVIDAPDFPARLCERLELRERSLLERSEHADHTFVRWRVVPAAELPAALDKALGGKGLAYVEEERRPKQTPFHREWTVVVDALSRERFRCTGTFDLERVGASQVRRTLRGSVDVKAFGVGGIIERHIAKGIIESYEKTSAMLRETFAGRS
jgi:hypothetical protein